MVDRYTKIVLTVITVALVWLCLWGPGPKWGTPAEAQTGTVDVNIAEVGGRYLRLPSGPLRDIPVDVQGTVEVEGTVKVAGTVEVEGSVECE